MCSFRISKFCAVCLASSVLAACVTAPEAPHPSDPLSFFTVSCELRKLERAPQWLLLACATHNQGDELREVMFAPVVPDNHPYLRLPQDAELRELEQSFANRVPELTRSQAQAMQPQGHATFYFPLLTKSERRPAYVELQFTQPVNGSKTVPISTQHRAERREFWPTAPEVGP